MTDVFEAVVQLIAQNLNVSQAIADGDYWPILDGNLDIGQALAGSVLKVIASTNGQTSVDINSIASEYIDYQNEPDDGAGTKFLAISHSQGGLFVNEAYQVALGMGLNPNLFSALEIATPASGVSPQGFYVNYAGDKLIYGAGLYPGIIGAAPANVPNLNLTYSPFVDFPSWLGHYFLTTYLAQNNEFAPVESAVINGIEQAALLLGPNCQGCANLTTGETQSGDYHVNPDGDLGGFVASTAHAEPTVFLSADSMICDTSQVLGSASITNQSFVMGAAVVADTTQVSSSGILDSAIVFGSSIVTSGSSVAGNAVVQDSSLIGSIAMDTVDMHGGAVASGSGYPFLDAPNLHGNAGIFDGSYISGNVSIFGSARTAYANIYTLSGGSVTIWDNASVFGYTGQVTVVGGDIYISGDAIVDYGSYVSGSTSLSGIAKASGCIVVPGAYDQGLLYPGNKDLNGNFYCY